MYYNEAKGLYQARRMVGNKKRSFYGKSEIEVEVKVAQAISDYEKGLKITTKEKRKFKYWKESWITYYEKECRVNQKIMEPDININRIKSLIKCLDHFDDWELNEITLNDIKSFFVDLAILNPNTGKPTAHKTIRDKANYLRMIFEHAKRGKALVNNPMDGWKVNIGELAKEIKPVTREQELMVIETPHKTQMLAMLILFGGLRPEEALALTEEDIDFGNYELTVLTINKVAVQNGGEHRIRHMTKTEAGMREVPIPNYLSDYLKRELPRRTHKYICSDTDIPLSKNNTDHWWDSYQIALRNKYAPPPLKLSHGAKIWDWEDFGRYQLRHSFSTNMRRANVDHFTKQNVMGHSNKKDMTEGVYTTLDLDIVVPEMLKFDKFCAENYYPVPTDVPTTE